MDDDGRWTMLYVFRSALCALHSPFYVLYFLLPRRQARECMLMNTRGIVYPAQFWYIKAMLTSDS